MTLRDLAITVQELEHRVEKMEKKDELVEFYIDCGDDGHEYIVPLKKQAAFDRWVVGGSGITPKWVVPLGDGHRCVVFANYRIEK